MCGIAGVFNFRTRKPVEMSLLDRMLDRIAHRGPDSRGRHIDAEFGFGMVRLAIIGGPEADQPMWTVGRRLAMVFNGEIYNYRDIAREFALDTTSDTQALAELFARRGPGGLTRLAGMFAAAAFEPDLRKLTLFRDRFGKKPLFVAETRDGVAFASEIKALLLIGDMDRALDLRAVGAFLNLSYMPPGLSPIKGIQQLPSGSFRSYGAEANSGRYWEPLSQSEGSTPEGGFEERFSVAVSRRLVSDVPIGVFLSGGLDSNAVLARALKLQPGSIARAYTIAPDTGASEAHVARRTCRHFGIPLEEVEVTPGTVLDNIERIVETADCLLANPPMFALDALSGAASGHIKVILTGSGGDELFYGYPTWKADWLFRYWRRTPGSMRRVIASLVHRLPPDYSPHSLSYALDKFVDCPVQSRGEAHAWWRTVIAGRELQALNPQLRDQWANIYRDAYGAAEAHAQGFERATALADLRVWWEGMGLYLSDVIPMGRGVELRSPFMDHELYEWSLGAPLHSLYHPFRSKPFLRKALRSEVPDWVVRGSKKPFYIPLAQWFRGPLADFLRDELHERTLRVQGLLDPVAVQRLIRDHLDGLRDNSFKLLALLVLTIWYRRVFLRFAT